MSVTFTKLFASITESTIWCEPDTTRLCWITMLAMADSRGRVFGSIPGLANRAIVSVDSARTAINTFLSPDPDSRSSIAEGRRIEVIDGGWRLINHEKYRALRDEESIKESKRNWAKKARAKAKEVDQNVDISVDCRSQENAVDRIRHNAEAEAEAYAENHIGNSLPRCPVDKIVDLYHQVLPELPKVIAVTDKRKASIKQRWNQIKPETEDDGLEGFKDYFTLVRSSDFLMGKKPATNGHKVFIANLEWLVNESNFVKVAERNYHERV